MFEFFSHCGFVGYLALALILAGLAVTATVGRKIKRPGSVAAAFAVAVLACGALGFGLGQHRVDSVVSTIERKDVEKRVMLLSIGTREASGHLILGGVGALVVSVVGGGLALAVRREER